MKPIFKTIPINKLGENESGSTHDFSGYLPSNDYILCFRNANTISGKHFHKGLSGRKNPEIVILVSGTLEIFCKDLETLESERMTIDAPMKLEIFPNVWHEFNAITDVIFLEICSIKEHESDTFYSVPEL